MRRTALCLSHRRTLLAPSQPPQTASLLHTDTSASPSARLPPSASPTTPCARLPHLIARAMSTTQHSPDAGRKVVRVVILALVLDLLSFTMPCVPSHAPRRAHKLTSPAQPPSLPSHHRGFRPNRGATTARDTDAAVADPRLCPHHPRLPPPLVLLLNNSLVRLAMGPDPPRRPARLLLLLLPVPHQPATRQT